MTKNNFFGVFSRSSISRFIYFILGMLLFSFSFNYFLLPNDLVFGGVSGLSIIFKNILDPSIFVFVVSSILLVISYIFLGKEKTFGSAVGSLLLPVFLKIMSFVTDNIDKVDEVFLAVIFGGLLAGVGIGFVYKAGFTMGGTDIINQIIHKYFKISLGKCMLISDGSIVLCSFFSFGLIKFMYAVVVLYIISTMTDKVLLGISNSKAFYIVTSQVNEVKNYVMVKLGHGITI